MTGSYTSILAKNGQRYYYHVATNGKKTRIAANKVPASAKAKSPTKPAAKANPKSTVKSPAKTGFSIRGLPLEMEEEIALKMPYHDLTKFCQADAQLAAMCRRDGFWRSWGKHHTAAEKEKVWASSSGLSKDARDHIRKRLILAGYTPPTHIYIAGTPFDRIDKRLFKTKAKAQAYIAGQNGIVIDIPMNKVHVTSSNVTHVIVVASWDISNFLMRKVWGIYPEGDNSSAIKTWQLAKTKLPQFEVTMFVAIDWPPA